MKNPEDHRSRADRDQVLVDELRRRPNSLASQARAVLAAEILEHRPRLIDHDSSVPPRDEIVVDPERRGVVAPDQVLSGTKSDLAIRPDETEGRSGSCGLSGGLRAKRVAEPLNRPDDSGRVGVVAQSLTQFGNQVREVGVRDERFRPEKLVKLVFGDRLRTPLDESYEERKRLGRDVNRPFAPDDLAGIRVEHVVAELEAHFDARRKASASRGLVAPSILATSGRIEPELIEKRANPERLPKTSDLPFRDRAITGGQS